MFMQGTSLLRLCQQSQSIIANKGLQRPISISMTIIPTPSVNPVLPRVAHNALPHYGCFSGFSTILFYRKTPPIVKKAATAYTIARLLGLFTKPFKNSVIG